MPIINELPLTQLALLMECNTLDSIKKLSFLREAQYDRLLSELPSMIAIEKIKKNRYVSFPSTLNVAATPIYFLWDVAYMCSLSATMLLSVSAICGGIALIAGIAYYVNSYKQQKKLKKMLEDYCLAKLKLSVLNQLCPTNVVAIPVKPTEISNLKRIKLIGSGIVNVTLPLFGIGFLGTVSILDVLGFVAMASIAGPIGFGVALFVTAMIGLYFGYKHYKYYQYTSEIESETSRMQEEVSSRQKKWEMKQLKRQIVLELTSKEEQSSQLSYKEQKSEVVTPRVDRQSKIYPLNRYPIFSSGRDSLENDQPLPLLRHRRSF